MKRSEKPIRRVEVVREQMESTAGLMFRESYE